MLWKKRQQVLVNIYKTAQYRKSQENPDILRLYNEFYGEANSHLAHELLHTSYTPRIGDNACNTVRKKANSAFVTQEFTICMCESCASKGSKELYSNLSETVKKLKMDYFINVKTIRLKDTHPGSDIYITLKGKKIEEAAPQWCFQGSK